jgi:putative addiction module CopG family antidote
LASFLDQLVQSGQYPSPEEALNEAVQLLQEWEGAEDALEALLREAEESGPAREVTPKIGPPSSGKGWRSCDRENRLDHR